jgi:L-alanine-DL-glutamate epimerase-like enolase superfamily enzyme
MTELISILRSFRFHSDDWRFSDLRIDIPPMSFGSDAANPHTQYSNAVAILENSSCAGIGATFTLGEGNQHICDGARFIVSQLEGASIGELMDSSFGLAEVLSNPLQLRWISPYAGVPMMAAGLVVNTILDAVSKTAGLPAWEFMSRLKSNDLIKLMALRHLGGAFNEKHVHDVLLQSEEGVVGRCEEVKSTGLPVYFTTWIGHDSDEIASQILKEVKDRGILQFKLKISPNIENDLAKLSRVKEKLPTEIKLCVDANQTLSFDQASNWLRELSKLGVIWLEEPFAPDNVLLFDDLIKQREFEALSCEVVTGENCPNIQTSSALVAAGIHRFQADPCRMMGLVDGLTTAAIAKIGGVQYTPHAGGAGLDEMSLHLQALNLARVDSTLNPRNSLTENVGFASHFYKQPALVASGEAKVPILPGLLVGFAPEINDVLIPFEEGISWVKL